MKELRLAVAVVVAYLLFVALATPAGMAAWLAAKVGGPGIALVQPEGSLWHGRASALDIALEGERYRLPRFEWRLRWLSLLQGRLAVAFEFGDAGSVSHGVVVLGRKSLRLEETEASLPLPLLLQALPSGRGQVLRGEARLRCREFALGPAGAEGDLDADWLGVASPLFAVNPLGDYRLHVSGTADVAAIKLATLQGPLQLEGSGEWSANRGLRFAGTARAVAERADALAPLLRVIGKEQGGGIYALAIGGGGVR